MEHGTVMRIWSDSLRSEPFGIKPFDMKDNWHNDDPFGVISNDVLIC